MLDLTGVGKIWTFGVSIFVFEAEQQNLNCWKDFLPPKICVGVKFLEDCRSLALVSILESNEAMLKTFQVFTIFISFLLVPRFVLIWIAELNINKSVTRSSFLNFLNFLVISNEIFFWIFSDFHKKSNCYSQKMENNHKRISWNRFVHISFLRGLFFKSSDLALRPGRWLRLNGRSTHSAQICTSLHPTRLIYLVKNIFVRLGYVTWPKLGLLRLRMRNTPNQRNSNDLLELRWGEVTAGIGW